MHIIKFLSHNKKIISFVFAIIVLIIILLLPEASPIQAGNKIITLSVKGKASLAVLVFAVILWITEAIPFSITGLLSLTILVITRASTFKELVKDGFGNPIILFFIGVLIFSAVINETRILKRITFYSIKKLGHNPGLIVLSFLSIGALLSGWITDMAVAALLLPMGTSILKSLDLKPLKSNFGKALMISCAWGPLIGGISTPAGCGPNPLTISFLKDLAGIEFSFINWMILGIPAMIIMVPIAWIVLLKFFPLEDLNLSSVIENMKELEKSENKIDKKEIIILTIFFITICLWITAPLLKDLTGGSIDYLSISFVAIFCSCLFFIPGIEVTTWEKVEKNINWGGILLVVTGLSIGMTIYKSGAAQWIAWIAFSSMDKLHPFAIIFVVVLGVSIMKVLFSSNTVTGIIVVPLMIALAKTLEIPPALLAIPAGITSSLAFILVTSSPTNVIPYSSGYFTIGDMAKAGIVMTILSSICVTLSIYFMNFFINIIPI